MAKKKLNLSYSLCNSDRKKLAKDVSETTYKTVEEAMTAAGKKYRFIVLGTQMEGEPIGQIEESQDDSKFWDLKSEAEALEQSDLKKANTKGRKKKTEEPVEELDIEKALQNKEAMELAKEEIKKAGAEKKPGVIAEIVTILGEGKVTKNEIVEKLTERFPDRDPEKMKKTVNCQVPNRLRREKELNIVQRSGKYWIEA